MHDLGGLVWIILVVIGVISSIRKNAQKARTTTRNLQTKAAAAPRPPRPAATYAAPAPPPVPPPVVHTAAPPTPMGYVLPPVVAPPAPVPPPAPVLQTMTLAPHPHPVGTSPIRGMFEGSATLVRAIVAAEVLGPPKSMQEQTIWSPRHSEPSI